MNNIVNSRISENEGKQLNKYSQNGWFLDKADGFFFPSTESMYTLSTAPSSGWMKYRTLHRIVFCGRLSVRRLEESLLNCKMKTFLLDTSWFIIYDSISFNKMICMWRNWTFWTYACILWVHSVAPLCVFHLLRCILFYLCCIITNY